MWWLWGVVDTKETNVSVSSARDPGILGWVLTDPSRPLDLFGRYVFPLNTRDVMYFLLRGQGQKRACV